MGRGLFWEGLIGSCSVTSIASGLLINSKMLVRLFIFSEPYFLVCKIEIINLTEPVSSKNIAWEVTYTRCLNNDHQLLFSQVFFSMHFKCRHCIHWIKMENICYIQMNNITCIKIFNVL